MAELISAVPLKAFARSLGFQAAGIASAAPDQEARSVFEARIERGLYDGLDWFDTARARRCTDPGTALTGAASVIALAAPYRTEAGGACAAPDGALRGRVARYAWGRDYHRVLEKRLRLVTAFVEREYGGRSRALVDYGALAERAYAARAGIGWFGKHTNLLLPEFGSWVLLCELITTVPFEPDPPLVKSCGGCRRCRDACPTGAISADYEVDNRRCISFQTIENRGWIPRDLRELMGDWVFGCDLCQDVCPVGRGRIGGGLPELAPADLEAALPELTTLLELDEAAFVERFRGRALMRAKRSGLARNACVALGNLADPRAVPALRRALLSDPAPIVRGHAAWALGRIGGLAATDALEAAAAIEPDAAARAEIEAALRDTSAPRRPARPVSGHVAWLAGPWRVDATCLNVA